MIYLKPKHLVPNKPSILKRQDGSSGYDSGNFYSNRTNSADRYHGDDDESVVYQDNTDETQRYATLPFSKSSEFCFFVLR